MYESGLLNKNKLFLGFNGWFKDIEKENPNNIVEKEKIILTETLGKKPSKSTSIKFEVILLHAVSIVRNLKIIKIFRDLCVEEYQQFKDKLDIKRDRIVYWSPTVPNVISLISPIITSLGFIMNMFMSILGSKFKLSIPYSMHKFVKGGIDKYKEVPLKIFEMVKNFWENYGKQIREYRSLDQHHYFLVNSCYINTESPEKLLLFLPDNPEIKRIDDMEFNREIEVISFLEEGFNKIHELIEGISKEIGYVEEEHSVPISFGKIGKIPILGSDGTIFFMVHNPKKKLNMAINVEEKNFKIITNDPKFKLKITTHWEKKN